MKKSLILFLALIFLAGCGKKTGVTSQELDFTAADGVVLKGTLYLPLDLTKNYPGVVLAHMDMNNRQSWEKFACKLAENGFITLAFDFRSFGDSIGGFDSSKIKDDALAAVTALTNFSRVDRENIALVGASMGGVAAVLAAAESNSVKALAAVSTPPSWKGLEPFAEIGKISPRPVLVISGVEDGLLDVRAARTLYLHAREPRQWIELPTNRHGTDIFATESAAELEKSLLDFLDSSLNPQIAKK